MPYSDNLYSALDEEADIEPIGVGETSTQDGDQGLGVTPQHAWLDSNTGSADAHADHDVGDGEDPHLLSPTDGYFGTASGPSPGTVVPASSNVPHVPNVLVEDPSLQRSTAEGKAREAEQERLRNGRRVSNSDDGDTSAYHPSHAAAASRNGASSTYTMTPTQQRVAPSSQLGATYYAPSSSSRIPPAATPSSYTTYSTPASSTYHGEPFSFLPREAPPAYTPSPTSPSNPQHSGGYSTFPYGRDATVNMGRPEETQGLLAHQPESMRDRNSGDLDELALTWRGRMRRARQHVNWGNCKIVLIMLVLLFVTAGFLASLVTGTTGSTGRHSPQVDRPDTEPGEPNMSYPEVDGDFSWDPVFFCKDAQIHRHVQMYDADFGTNKQLVLVERTTDDDGRRGWGEVHVQGAVIFRRAGPDTPKSAVTVETTITDERLQVHLSWDADRGSLNIIVPHRVEWSQDRPRACVNIKVTVWVPEASDLLRLDTDVVHLDIKLLDNLSLSVGDEGTKLSSTVGAITSASTGSTARDDKLIDVASPPPPSFLFRSRIIDVRTTAAPITGIWPLYDYLGLQSTSGNIRVAVSPQDADASDNPPKPAILYVKSLSGNVDLREPIHAAEATFRIAQSFSVAEDRRRAEGKVEAYLPPGREYRVDVHTTSGDITAAAAFSSSAGFRSTSGTVSVELLPVLDVALLGGESGGAREVELSTASTSGATDVRVLEPLWVGTTTTTDGLGVVLQGGSMGRGRRGYVGLGVPPTARSPFALGTGGDWGSGKEKVNPLRCLYSTHTSTSADIKLRYPASWEGDVSLSSLTGALQVDGEGVKIIKAGSDWPGVNKNVLARKGEKGEGGRAVGKSTSGDVDFLVGEKK
ncbi:hypothetical protein C8A01DRAFT_35525 [Parachaetomium inaequale]|uniref:Adhesin domain-containing protein n=1 Tax=Parachaetomium inaequale TaxID=2588326 RepID=A0AAN6PK22_9PEZI|nr:hypothetical protein C8A01DRAFT_35525 [Parachaetomium inaequale]